MLISVTEGIVNTHGFKAYSYGENKIFLNGLLFLRGKIAGQESLDVVAYEYFEENRIRFDGFYGSFSMILSKKDSPVVVFTDNSCMQGLFLGKGHLGGKLNEVAEAESAQDFDEEEVCNYLALTRRFGGHTIIKGIETTNNLYYYEVSRDGITCREKGLNDISGSTSISNPLHFFEDISFALSEKKVICALTGGYDSRMVLALLCTYKHLDSFIGGDNYECKEIAISQKVAEAGGINHRIIPTERPGINPDVLKLRFLNNNGAYTDFSTGGYRVTSYVDELERAGYEVLVTGNTGGMHKDLWFLQDFPFYARKKTRVSRFFSFRMEVISYKEYLGEAMLSIYSSQRISTLENMSHMIKPINTQSYDMFGWELDCQSTLRSPEASMITVYSPLQEIDLVRFSFHLPRMKRFYNLFQRDLTTTASKAMARIPTVYGTTESSEPLYILRDAFLQTLSFIKRATNLTFRKLFRRFLFQQPVSNLYIEDDIRSLDITSTALDWCKHRGFISNKCSVSTIPFWLLNRVLNLWFTEELILRPNRSIKDK